MGMIGTLLALTPWQRQRTQSARVLVRGGALLVFVAALGLVACGGQSVVGGGGPQNCGTIHSGAGGAVTQGTSTTVDCFWQAYSHCQPATLQFSRMGVDTSDTHTFTIKSANGGCQVTDSVGFFQVSGGIHSTKSYQCSGMRQSSGGLVIEQCGEEGSLVIPSPNGTPAP